MIIIEMQDNVKEKDVQRVINKATKEGLSLIKEKNGQKVKRIFVYTSGRLKSLKKAFEGLKGIEKITVSKKNLLDFFDNEKDIQFLEDGYFRSID